MTYTDWTTTSDPTWIIEQLGTALSERKLRLFAAACCRRIWDVLDAPARAAVECTEAFADHLVSPQDLLRALRSLNHDSTEYAHGSAIEAVRMSLFHPAIAGHFGREGEAALAREFPMYVSIFVAYAKGDEAVRNDPASSRDVAVGQEYRGQAAVLRDIVGSAIRRRRVRSTLFRTLDSGISEMARAMYSDPARADFKRLATALHDTGCTDKEMLLHCREITHVRECWLIDELLDLA